VGEAVDAQLDVSGSAQMDGAVGTDVDDTFVRSGLIRGDVGPGPEPGSV
jgi:hypothetical protein